MSMSIESAPRVYRSVMVYVDKELKKLSKDAGKVTFAKTAKDVVRAIAGLLKRVIRLANKGRHSVLL